MKFRTFRNFDDYFLSPFKNRNNSKKMDTSDEIIRLSDSDSLEELPDADPYHIEPMNLAIKEFPGDPPSLMELAFDSEPLKNIAKHLHILMQTEGNVKYCQKTRQEIEKVICVFVRQSSLIASENIKPMTLPGTKQVEPEKSRESNISREDFKKLTKELVRAQEKINELTQKNKAAEQKEENYKENIKALKIENNALFQSKNNLIQQLNATRREKDALASLSKAEIESLKDKYNALKDKNDQTEYSLAKAQKLLTEEAEEIAKKNAELTVLKGKIDAKNIKIREAKRKSQQDSALRHKVEAENEQLICQNNDLTAKLESYTKECNQELLQNEISEKNALSATVDYLVKYCQDTSEEIIKSKKQQEKCIPIIQKQMEIINNYERVLGSMKKERDSAVEEKKSIIQEMENTKLEVDAVKSNDVKDSYFDSIFEILKSVYSNIQPDDTLEIVQGLLKGTIDSPLASMNRRLINIIENQLRFLSSMVRNGEVKLLLLSSDNEDVAYMDEDKIRDQILVEIARCRTFITMNNLKHENEISSNDANEKLNSLIDSCNLEQREAFDLIAVNSQNANIMRIFGEKLIDIKQRYEEALQEVSKIINYDGEIENIGNVLVEKLRAYRAVAKRLNDLTNVVDYNNYDESLRTIEKLFKQDYIIRTLVDSQLREATEFTGDIEEVVTYSAKYIRDMMKEIEELSSYNASELITQIQKLKDENATEKENNTKALIKYEKEIDEKSTELDEMASQLNIATEKINNLTNELSMMTEKKKEFQSKYNALTETIEQLDVDMKRLRNEKEETKKLIENKEAAFQTRVDSILSNERERHSQEVEELKNRFEEKESALNEKLKDKSLKLKEVKSKLKEVITTYEAALQKQKETMAAIRSQNQELLLDASQKKPTSNNKEMDIPASIKSLEAENTLLRLRVQQLNERIEKTQSERDTYWQSQMAIHEAEIESSNKKQIDEVRKEHEEYLTQVYDILSKYSTGSFDGSDQATLNLVSNVIEELEAANKRADIACHKAEILTRNNGKTDSTDIPKVVKTIKSLQAWKKWASEIYGNSTGLDPSQFKSDADLRFRLGEMILSSISNKKLVDDLSSLRVQKQALLRGAGSVEGSRQLSFASLVRTLTFIRRISSSKAKISNPNSVCISRNVLRH